MKATSTAAALWDASILRLNQLGYFEPLKENESYDIKRNPNSNTVDINLKVKETRQELDRSERRRFGHFRNVRRRQLLDQQLPGFRRNAVASQAQVGTTLRSVNLGFTEPYFFDHPHAGRHQRLYPAATITTRGGRFRCLSGENLIPFYNSLGSNNLLNYIQNSKGASLSAQLPDQAQLRPLGI